MRELMSYLPAHYKSSAEMVAIQQAIGQEMRLTWNHRDDLLLQLDPHTATWGLNYWESAFGLQSDDAMQVELRRNRVIARIRGMGTTSVTRLQSVVETFCPGCDVSVIEHYGNYLVEIGLTITDQEVQDESGLIEMVDLIMPAHLAWGFSIVIETAGTILCGICSELAGVMDIWPLVARQIEVTPNAYTAGAQTYHGIMEIYPEGGESNG